MSSIEEIRAKAAIGTTRPLPQPKPKTPKREKRRKRREEDRNAEWQRSAEANVAEPRDEELEAMERHLDSMLPNPVVAEAVGVRIVPFRNQRPGLDPRNQQNRKAAYDGRDAVVRSMGFRFYRDYLASPLWAKIRARILARDPACALCNRPSRHVHHVKYTKKVLEGRDDRQLVGLCAGCHHKIEFRERDHEKLSPRQVRSKLNQLLTNKLKAQEA